MSYIEFDRSVIENCLNQLSENDSPHWGKLSPQQMVEHLSAVILISVGKIKLDIHTPEAHLEKSKAFLMSDKAMPVEYNAPFIKASDLKLRNTGLREAISEHLDLIDAFYLYFEQNPQITHIHPVFGNLNNEEWIWLHRKHSTHHLTQFGLIQ